MNTDEVESVTLGDFGNSRDNPGFRISPAADAFAQTHRSLARNGRTERA